MRQVKTKRIEVEYTNGRKIVIEPYKHEGRFVYGFNYYDKRGRQEMYEGGWNAERIADWIREILEDDNIDYTKELNRIQEMYSP